uniref:ribosomal protein L32 n=1 Tax=Rhodella violacea TaxID=2801 RepID=UPI001FCD9F01|nr:ribosomal protein L32 [Rhodella violacea]UNJ18155.1 ribosomal protein L32 [Rhodella violacea]
MYNLNKKRLSKSKKNSRKAQWKRQAFFKAKEALSMAKSILSNNSNMFIPKSIDTES